MWIQSIKQVMHSAACLTSVKRHLFACPAIPFKNEIPLPKQTLEKKGTKKNPSLLSISIVCISHTHRLDCVRCSSLRCKVWQEQEKIF